MSGLPVTFTARAEPLATLAVAGLGEHRRTLAARLAESPDDVLRRMSGVATPEAVVVLGPASALPWFDGALYLGARGGLLMPAWAEPDVHPALLEKALRKAMPQAPLGPLALLFTRLAEPPLVVPLAAARPLSRERLHSFAGGTLP